MRLAIVLASALVGLWGTETTFGPEVRGPFTLERTASAWTLRVAGFEVSAPATGDEFRIALPSALGELRGSTTRAFWIQPRGNLGQFATPVALERSGPNAWRGTIAPLEDRLSLYLLIRNDDGTLKGSFHNPEVNWNGRAPWFRVEETEANIELLDPASGKVRFVQPYDKNQQQIAMDFGVPVALTPRTREHAVGFQPRTPPSTSYRYRVPLERGDGWRTARARDVGLDEELLRKLVEHIVATDSAAHDSARIHSVLVARHGRLVLEEYFFGYSADRPHDLRSASKSLTSLMVGIAMLPPDSPIAPGSPITIAHLLTHTSGLACDDDDEKSPGNEDVMQAQRKQNDWYRYFLDLPAVHPPGTNYAYCSAGINFAGGIVAKTTGTWLPEFFDRHIARPMQIERYHMNLMPDGQGYAAGGIYMRPRDFLKFGPMLLGGGVWNGKRIVSKQWIETSTSKRYAWHRHKLGEYDEYEASGNGGQFLIVVPKLDLAVVITAGNYGQGRVWTTFRDELVPRYVLSAVRDKR